MPRKASEVGACKDLEGHIFTIGSANKGKDGDMLRTSSVNTSFDLAKLFFVEKLLVDLAI